MCQCAEQINIKTSAEISGHVAEGLSGRISLLDEQLYCPATALKIMRNEDDDLLSDLPLDNTNSVFNCHNTTCRFHANCYFRYVSGYW